MQKIKAAVIGRVDSIREALKIQKIICDIYNNNETRDWYAGQV